jgi:uncharacterized protein (TIGR00299 family) protein
VKALYLDCYSGISGNMFLAALLHLGVDERAWRAQIARLPLGEFEVRVAPVLKNGIAALYAEVLYPPQHAHRGLAQVMEIVRRAELDSAVETRAERIFRRLAEAEAQVHGTTVERVHFHEVGAVDSIVDVVSAALLLEMLEADHVCASAVRTGHGTTRAAHGVIPIPGPATSLLLRGIPSYAGDVERELCTPTGAAILAVCAERFGPQPLLEVERVGWGAGSWDLPMPNCLRAVYGTALETPAPAPGAWEEQLVLELECHVDDMAGEELGFLQERLLTAGALDVVFAPAQMKKNRPATLIRVLAPPQSEEQMLRELFLHSSSLGCRVRRERRVALLRERVRVETAWGQVDAMRTVFDGTDRLHPEYEDCAALARAHGLPLAQVLAAARQGRVL